MQRRKFIKGTIAISSLLAIGGITYMSTETKQQILSSKTSNPKLKTILSSWEGTPLNQDGRFMNHEFPFIQGFGQVLKWMTQTNPQKKVKNEDPWRMPVLKEDSFLSSKEDMVVLLGHASFFIRLGGKQILIDPVFGNLIAVKRLTELPINPSKLVNIDYVLISHAHFDHCDKDSIKQLQKQNPKTTFLTGLKMEPLLREWVGQQEIQEAGWYQQYNLTDGLEITYLPSRHWSNRSLLDINKRLWGAFVIKGFGKTIYFAGDSGYGSHFKEVGTLFPDIDVALIGTGAYSPRWFMAPFHQDPEHAVQAFNDTQAKTMIPFHYGTFDVSDEPLSEPEQILAQLLKDGKVNGSIKIPKLGEATLL